MGVIAGAGLMGMWRWLRVEIWMVAPCRGYLWGVGLLQPPLGSVWMRPTCTLVGCSVANVLRVWEGSRQRQGMLWPWYQVLRVGGRCLGMGVGVWAVLRSEWTWLPALAPAIKLFPKVFQAAPSTLPMLEGVAIIAIYHRITKLFTKLVMSIPTPIPFPLLSLLCLLAFFMHTLAPALSFQCRRLSPLH